MKTLDYHINKLLSYCQKEGFAGYDPYDCLNSKFLKKSPFYKSKLLRLIAIQSLKRLPVNIRPALLIPKTQNPKALALFLKGFVRLKKAGFLKDEDLINQMIQQLITMRSNITSQPNEPNKPNKPNKPVKPSTQQAPHPTNPVNQNNQYWCWGYSFPWQTKTILVPRAYPNLVCTVFVADALLDVYEYNNNVECLSMAQSAAEYILNELFWNENRAAGFSYPLPNLKNEVYNANFLAAALLCRLGALTRESKLTEPALKATRYSCSKQNPDGSWFYGGRADQKWIDNFHTGFNLCALKVIKESLSTREFDDNIAKGFNFYRNNFLNSKGVVKYFHDRTFPIDSHSIAQNIITLLYMQDLGENNSELVSSIFHWAINNMWDEKGYFYYQRKRIYKIKIPYMRWSLAWMFLALSALLKQQVLT